MIGPSAEGMYLVVVDEESLALACTIAASCAILRAVRTVELSCCGVLPVSANRYGALVQNFDLVSVRTPHLATK